MPPPDPALLSGLLPTTTVLVLVPKLRSVPQINEIGGRRNGGKCTMLPINRFICISFAYGGGTQRFELSNEGGET